MDRTLGGFLKMYLFVVAFFFVLGLVLASLFHQDVLFMLSQVYLWMGFAYVVASVFAWSGVANLYRYSPTLFAGSPSYRQQAVKGKMFLEGRDDRAFLLGLSFGGAIAALGAALLTPVFIVVDLVAVVLVALVLHVRRARHGVRA